MPRETLAIILHDTGTLTTTSDQGEVSPYVRGPGRLLGEGYSKAGNVLGSVLNRASHKLGYGPLAISAKIEDIFGSTVTQRMTRLHELYSTQILSSSRSPEIKNLEKCCGALIRRTRS